MYSRNGGFVDRDQALSLLLPAAGAVEGVRSMARRALSLADQTRDAASRARSVSGVDWRSIAAESFRRDLASCAADPAAGICTFVTFGGTMGTVTSMSSLPLRTFFTLSSVSRCAE